MDSNLKKTKWHRLVSRGRHHAVLYIDSVNDGNRKGYLKKYLGVYYIFQGYRQFDGSRWITEKDHRDFVNIFERRTKEDPSFLFRWAIHFEKSAKNIISETNKYRKNNWKKTSNSEILKVLTKFQDYISILWCGPVIYAWYFFFNDIKLEELKDALEKKCQNKFGKLWSYLIQSEKLTLAGEEKLSLLKLAKRFKESGIDGKALRSHAEKFAYLNKYIFWGDGLSVADVRKNIKELIKKDIADIGREIKSFRRVRIKLKDYNLSNEEKELIKGFKKMSYAVNFADESCNYFAHHLRPLFSELAARLEISYEQLVSMTFEETRDSVRKNKPAVSKQELSDRLQDHALVYVKNKVYIFTDRKLASYRKIESKKELKFSPEKNKMISGTVAFAGGKLEGKIRVIKDISEIASFRKGEILVTQMTNPTYLPAMQKSSALITDEGGLLCHAAVVARELRIPCIIGTKIATKVLHDGDLVEVDAAKGIIRKLK